MFHTIRQNMKDRMATLEKIDAKDRGDGTERMKRLRQIPPETGRFLAIVAASAPEGSWVEIGTSAGYSTMWLSLAAREKGKKIHTFELLNEKVRMARETFQKAEIEDYVSLHHGNALILLHEMDNVSFCFLDTEKHLYQQCYDIIVPKMVPGGILVADNAINHQETLQPMMDMAAADPRVDTVMVPIGMGEFIVRKR